MNSMSGSLRRLVRSVGETVLDTIGPPACSLCGCAEVESDRVLCAACAEAVNRCCMSESCPRCGQSTPPVSRRESGCSRCPPRRPPFDRVLRVGSYDGGLRSLFLKFKYGGAEELDTYFAGRLARCIARSDIYEAIDALVPVPTCWQHRLRRQFHPAETLASQLSRLLHIPTAPLLDRTGGGPHQTGQPQTVRLSNVKGKFHVARGCRVEGAMLCLVDDIMTSGATASECARVLKRAGAGEVIVAVVARAEDDPASLGRI